MVHCKEKAFLPLSITLLFGIILLLGNTDALACSRVLWDDNGQAVLVARSMDWPENMQDELWAFPRGMKRSGLVENPVTWTSKYGSLVVASFPEKGKAGISDGINEKGLAANLLWLDKSDYGPRDKKIPGLAVSLWAQYFLDNFATVDEAVRSLAKNPFQVVTFSMTTSQGFVRVGHLHLSLEDKTGDSAILEYAGGKLSIHHDRKYAIMTNEPSFEEQQKNLMKYESFGGGKPLPGTDSPQDRFVRAAYYIKHLPAPHDLHEALAYIFSVIRNVSAPYGMSVDPKHPNVSPTIWRSVADLTNGSYYFESTTSPYLVWADLDEFDFKEGSPALSLSLSDNPDLSGNVSRRFAKAGPFPYFVPIDRPDIEQKTKDSAQRESALVKDEVILPRAPGEWMEVRHIVFEGTNEEIGRAMGDVAQKDYGVKALNRYADTLYAKARLEYMRRNNPILLEWMKGIARSYDISLDDTIFDASYIPSFYTVPQCSAILIPSTYSANGHTFYFASRDYYLATFSEIMNRKPMPGEKKIFSEAAIIEIYPDKGYPSLFVSVGDLTFGADIVNSEGLSVSAFEDDTYGITKTPKDISRATGLSMSQAMMLIANTCATVDEAKEALLINKVSMPPMPMHMQVSDRTGQAFIYEISPDDFSGHFVYNDGKPQAVTNHGVYAYPDIDKMPIDEKDPYDTYNRYARLVRFIDSHEGKFSVADGWKAMDMVLGAVPEAAESARLKIPLRTFYQIVLDNEDRSIRIKFYLKDESVDPVTGYAKLIFSQPFEFKLRPRDAR